MRKLYNRLLPVGTRSVLFGVHCFWLHPLLVALAWWKLYGFPTDWRLWFCFYVHDLGYWGKPNMDGPEGETHVELGANLAHRFLDKKLKFKELENGLKECTAYDYFESVRWRWECLYHSRFYAKQEGMTPSKLCFADKYVQVIEPWWFYLPRAILSGEVYEYMAKSPTKYKGMNLELISKKEWYKSIGKYMKPWIEAHINGEPDTWTPHNYENSSQ